MSYSTVLPELPDNLARDEVWVLAQDYRCSRAEPIPAEMLAAQRRLYQLDVQEPRSARRRRSAERYLAAHPTPPRLDVWER